MSLIGQFSDPGELGKLLQLVLGCAISCEKKQGMGVRGSLGENPRKSSSPISVFSTLTPRAHPENYDTGGIGSACGNGSHPGGRRGCPTWQGAAGEGTSLGQRQLATGESGLCLELSWPDFPVSHLPAPPSSKSKGQSSVCAGLMAEGQPLWWDYREKWLWGQEDGEVLRMDHGGLEDYPQRAQLISVPPHFPPAHDQRHP